MVATTPSLAHSSDDARSGNEAYGKNLRVQMGRCPVRSIFSEALDVLEQKQHLLGSVA